MIAMFTVLSLIFREQENLGKMLPRCMIDISILFSCTSCKVLYVLTRNVRLEGSLIKMIKVTQID